MFKDYKYLKWIVKDWDSCKKILKLILPLTLQLFLLSLSSIVDVYVLGNYSSESSINALSIDIQIFSVLFFVLLSIITGSNIFSGQYLGTKEFNKLKETNNFKILLGFIITIIFIVVVFIIGPNNFINFLISNKAGNTSQIKENKDTIAKAVKYFYYLLPTLFIIVLTTPFYMLTSFTNQIHVSLIIVGCAVVVNATISFVLVKYYSLDIVGVGIANIVTRCFTLTCIIIYCIWKKPIWLPNLNFFKIRKDIWKKCILSSLGLLIGEIAFPVFLLLQSIIVAKVGNNNLFAGLNSVNYINDLFYSSFFGFYAAVPIFISKQLGEGKTELAKTNSEKIISVSLVILIISAIFMISGFFWYSKLLNNLSPEGAQIASWFLLGNGIAIIFLGLALQKLTFIKTGNYTVIGSLTDVIPNYLLYLPVLFLLLYFKPMPYKYIFLIVPLCNLVQYVVSTILYRYLKWNKKLV